MLLIFKFSQWATIVDFSNYCIWLFVCFTNYLEFIIVKFKNFRVTIEVYSTVQNTVFCISQYSLEFVYLLGWLAVTLEHWKKEKQGYRDTEQKIKKYSQCERKSLQVSFSFLEKLKGWVLTKDSVFKCANHILVPLYFEHRYVILPL